MDSQKNPSNAATTSARPQRSQPQQMDVSLEAKGEQAGSASAAAADYPDGYGYSGHDEDFHFEVPPEAPVFRPTLNEFSNPLTYISKIRPIAEKYGICKIIPPSSWQPPFSLDVDQMRFTPRVQRLNELEARTRVRLNFLDQISKFWELQGSSLKIPMVERKPLDLYSLYRAVQDEGGLEVASRERKWSKIAARLGYPQGKSVGTMLRNHYDRILFPFDVFMTNKHNEHSAGDYVEDDAMASPAKGVAASVTSDCDNGDTEAGGNCDEDGGDHHNYKPHGIESRQNVPVVCANVSRRSKRFTTSTMAGKQSNGGGQQSNSSSSGSIADRSDTLYQRFKQFQCQETKNKRRQNPRGRPKRSTAQADPLAKYVCLLCNRGDGEENMLLCDGCDDSYHMFCLVPPIAEIPKGDWRCPKCTVEEVNKPIEAFGFEQAQRTYSLQEFGKVADQFKSEYFGLPVHQVPTEQVEREFWRIVSSIDEDVTVEYGADLHTMDHGSGFPTRASTNLSVTDQTYVDSDWNLNNLPLLDESILKHITADISGMKVPWMYVGMCFATFCWHNEDHWSYSVNYLHWGESKTWYGVPGSNAERFEKTMKGAAPELFDTQPDLLHQLVTIMNPNILMNSGVPVYRTDQKSGEFVITFPRAYHAGFNQGYNFAEAVNFAPADWLKIGRECINHYSLLRRFCVFSHDELVCKMALEPESLNIGIATACYIDMAEMVDTEQKLRKALLDWGVSDAEREAFELIPDDERQCDVCKTTCFLAAVICSCGPSALESGGQRNGGSCSSGASSVESSPVKGEAAAVKEVRKLCCLRHYQDLCKKCSPQMHKLKYRYTLNELPLILRKLKIKVEGFEKWLNRVKEIFDKSIATQSKPVGSGGSGDGNAELAGVQGQRKRSMDGTRKAKAKGAPKEEAVPEVEGRTSEKIPLEELREIIREADTHKYPNSRILEKLRANLLEAEKCITVINHLLSVKNNNRPEDNNNGTEGPPKKGEKRAAEVDHLMDCDLGIQKRVFVNKVLESERKTMLSCGYLERFYAVDQLLGVQDMGGSVDGMKFQEFILKMADEEPVVIDTFTMLQKERFLTGLASVKRTRAADEAQKHAVEDKYEVNFEELDRLFDRILNNSSAEEKGAAGSSSGGGGQKEPAKAEKKLSETELDLFVKEIENLFCNIAAEERLINLLQFKCKFFKQRMLALLNFNQRMLYSLQPLPKVIEPSQVVVEESDKPQSFSIKWKGQRVVARADVKGNPAFYVKAAEVDLKQYIYVYLKLLENLVGNEEFYRTNFYIDNPMVKLLFLKYKQIKLLKKIFFVSSLTLGDLLEDATKMDAASSSGEFFRLATGSSRQLLLLDPDDREGGCGGSSLDFRLRNFLRDLLLTAPDSTEAGPTGVTALPLMFVMNKNFLKNFLFLKYKTLDEISEAALEKQLLLLHKFVQFVEQCDFNIKELLFGASTAGDDENLAPKGRGRKSLGSGGEAGGFVATGKRRRKNFEGEAEREGESQNCKEDCKIWRINDLKSFVKNIILKNFYYYLMDDFQALESRPHVVEQPAQATAGGAASGTRTFEGVIVTFVDDFLLLSDSARMTTSPMDEAVPDHEREMLLMREINDEVYGRRELPQKGRTRRRNPNKLYNSANREEGEVVEGATAVGGAVKHELTSHLGFLNNLLKRAVFHNGETFSDESESQIYRCFGPLDAEFQTLWQESTAATKVKQEVEDQDERSEAQNLESTINLEFQELIQQLDGVLRTGRAGEGPSSMALAISKSMEQDETIFRNDALSEELYKLDPLCRRMAAERTLKVGERQLAGMNLIYNHFVFLKVHVVRLNKLIYLIRKYEKNQNYPSLVNFITLFRFYRECFYWRIHIYEFERIFRKNLLLAMEWLIKTFYIFLYNESEAVIKGGSGVVGGGGEDNGPKVKMPLKFNQKGNLAGAKRGPKKSAAAAATAEDKEATAAGKAAGDSARLANRKGNGTAAAEEGDSSVSESCYLNQITHAIIRDGGGNWMQSNGNSHGHNGGRTGLSEQAFLERSFFADATEVATPKKGDHIGRLDGGDPVGRRFSAGNGALLAGRFPLSEAQFGSLLNHYLLNNDLFNALTPYSFPLNQIKYNLNNNTQSHVMVNRYKEAELVELRAYYGCNFKVSAAKRAGPHEAAEQRKRPKSRSCDLCSKRDRRDLWVCNLCKNYFHRLCYQGQFPDQFTCLAQQYGYVRRRAVADGGESADSPREAFVVNLKKKLLCPFCIKTKRPRLEVILKLLVLLQKIPIRIPEGEALQCLTERAMNWQDRVRKFLRQNFFAAADESTTTMAHSNGSIGVFEKIRNIIFNMSKCKRKFLARRDGAAGRSSSNKHDREVEHTSADTDSEGEASPARPTTKDRVPPDGDAHRPEMPQHVTDADELDLFLQQNLVKERACSSFCAKGVRKDLLKLIIEGDLLEVSLDEQQLLASLWYQLNKWKRDHQPSSSGGPATTTTTGDEAPNDDDSLSEMSDSELEPNGDSDWSEGDNEQADPSLEKVGGAGAKPQRNPAMAKKEKLKRKSLEPQSGHPIKLKRARRTLATAVGGGGGPSGPTRKTRTQADKEADRKKGGGGGEQVANDSPDQDDDDDEPGDEDDEEMCSSKKCLEPTGSVDWVQCDGGCNKWFHMVCVGLLKVELKPDEDFICQICSSKRKSSGGGCSKANVTKDAPQSTEVAKNSIGTRSSGSGTVQPNGAVASATGASSGAKVKRNATRSL